MFNNIFCEMKGKKVIHWGGGGGGWGEWGNHPNFVLEVSFQYLLGHPIILLGYFVGVQVDPHKTLYFLCNSFSLHHNENLITDSYSSGKIHLFCLNLFS